eukprot:13877883-Alexandrium_andersonii.AAC.1
MEGMRTESPHGNGPWGSQGCKATLGLEPKENREKRTAIWQCCPVARLTPGLPPLARLGFGRRPH